MPIEIGGVQLSRIHRLTTLEDATFVSHRVPGLQGSLVQKLGRDSVRLSIEGIFYGASASDDLETLRQVHKGGDPVDFLAEIVGKSYFSQVIIERFEVRQTAGNPGEFDFAMQVAEYVVPPEPAATQDFASVDAAIADAAQSFMAAATLPDLLNSIPDIKNPLEPLSGAMDGVKGAMGNLQSVAGNLESLFGKG